MDHGPSFHQRQRRDHKIAGLDDPKRYWVEVRAINNIGNGEWSGPTSGSPYVDAGTTAGTAQHMELALYSRCTVSEYELRYDENGDPYYACTDSYLLVHEQGNTDSESNASHDVDWIAVYGPDAEPVEHNELWELSPNFRAKHDRLWFNPAVGGTHYIELRGVGGSGRYSVAVTDVDIGEERNTKGRIRVGGEARSRVNYNGDIDGISRRPLGTADATLADG